MVASRQIVIPFYGGSGRQCGHGFGALAQVFWSTAIPFLLNYIVPAAKRVGTYLLEFYVPENADVDAGGKIFETAAKTVGRQTLSKHWGGVSRKKSASRVLPTKPTRQTSVAKRHLYKYFSIIMSSNFRYQPFLAVSGNIGGIFQWLTISCRPTNKISILLPHSMETALSFNFKRIRTFTLIRDRGTWLWNWNCQSRGYGTNNSKEVKKEHKDETKTDVETEEEQEASVPLVDQVNNSWHFFSTVEVYINNQQNYNSNGLYAHKSYISNNFKGAISE